MKQLVMVLAGVIAAAGSPSPLGRYVDHARALVVSASTGGDPQLRRQNAALDADVQGLKARDVVVIAAIGATAHDPGGEAMDAAAVRTVVGLPAGRFGVALVGNDGGVKLRRSSPVSVQALFQLIDAMPMRQQETHRQGMQLDHPG